eukprot:TRINITY_DN2250_c0_g1_i7.p1 TRINITY_DN2250_c0_g1~~TRINITY_DN2250_c0_g1_i7.p1  ORF type:complete len:1246 (+),score=218.61 TRINITY_DN2250_c0_g1_i7:3530-7267(+)
MGTRAKQAATCFFILCLWTSGIVAKFHSISLPFGTINPNEMYSSRSFGNDVVLGSKGTFLIQLHEDTFALHKSHVEHMLGFPLKHYAATNTFVVSLRTEAASEVLTTDAISWFSEYLPEYKYNEDVIQASGSPVAGLLSVICDSTFPEAVLDVDGCVTEFSVLSDVMTYRCDDVSAATIALSHRPYVLAIERLRPLRLHNNALHSIVQSGSISQTPIWNMGLQGDGQVIGIADTGLNLNSCFFDNGGCLAPFGTTNLACSKVVSYYKTERGDYTDSNGHGTHVSGTAAGKAQSAAASALNGVAPNAKIAFTDASSSGDNLYFSSIINMLQQVYTNAGARIHSDSWGADDNGAYSQRSYEFDKFLWDHPDMVAVISAGNAGPSLGTVGSPGTAKNVITVGATIDHSAVIIALVRVGATVISTTAQSVFTFSGAMCFYRATGSRCTLSAVQPCANPALSVAVLLSQSCYYTNTYALPSSSFRAVVPVGFQWLGAHFTGIPASVPVLANVYSFYETDFLNATSVSIETFPENAMVDYYSSRGPTLDGRVKPDVTAPGTQIISASNLAGSNGVQSCANKTSTGTSMATPGVAGAAALVRQYFMNGFYPSGGSQATDRWTPTGALVKAMIVHSGQRAAQSYSYYGWEVTATTQDQGLTGRVQLNNVLRVAGSSAFNLYARNNSFSNAAQELTECFAVTQGSQFRVTLAWYDYPTLSQGRLANDLDLTVLDPSGTLHRGNGRWDGTNNVEVVTISTPALGDYMITVDPYKIVSGPQLYGLVATGSFQPCSFTWQGIVPASGSAYGGYPITISVTALPGVTVRNVTFGGQRVTVSSWTQQTTIIVTAPVWPLDRQDVVVAVAFSNERVVQGVFHFMKSMTFTPTFGQPNSVINLSGPFGAQQCGLVSVWFGSVLANIVSSGNEAAQITVPDAQSLSSTTARTLRAVTAVCGNITSSSLYSQVYGCAAGRFWVEGSGSCQLCSAGTYQPDTRSFSGSCTRCATGQASGTGAGACQTPQPVAAGAVSRWNLVANVDTVFAVSLPANSRMITIAVAPQYYVDVWMISGTTGTSQPQQSTCFHGSRCDISMSLTSSDTSVTMVMQANTAQQVSTTITVQYTPSSSLSTTALGSIIGSLIILVLALIATVVACRRRFCPAEPPLTQLQQPSAGQVAHVRMVQAAVPVTLMQMTELQDLPLTAIDAGDASAAMSQAVVTVPEVRVPVENVSVATAGAGGGSGWQKLVDEAVEAADDEL